MKISVKVPGFDRYSLEGDISEVIETLTAIKEEHPTAVLDIDTEYEYGESYIIATACYTREETDAECKTREEKEAIQRAAKEAYDRKVYERLKKEFEE